ncbi:MAG: hypothetical protein M1813_007496 [Trichoglossum hirsutum]|nr:MAG: hypothetical protein M1813_007496 [Trichoglossum hirsutum]
MGQPYSLYANVNFSQCNETAEDLLRRNLTQYFHVVRSRGTLTYPACVELCHNGIERWPTDQIVGRFSLWLVPAVVLIAHFHHAPVSLLNTCAITFHHISSPIDSMRSMLTRLELQRRCLHHVEEEVRRERPAVCSGSLRRLNAKFRHNVHPDNRHLAVIWCAYDELGCTQMIDTIREPLDRIEWLYTKEAAYQLTTNRTETQRPTWVAVIGYLGALAGAFVRTKIQRENNQTSHTIAVVSLLSYFVALVLISSTIGVFRSVPDALNILQRLRQNIINHRKESGRSAEPELFPGLPRFEQSQTVSWDSASKPKSCQYDPDSRDLDLGDLENWLKVAPWTGINSSWRPCEEIRIKCSTRNRNPWLLRAYSFAFVLLGSYCPAVVLSIFSGSIGFGCRCLAWTSIACVWVISLTLDYTMKSYISTAKLLWICTIVKDFLFSGYIAGSILAIQVGVLNSCWCRANVITNHGTAGVNLGPLEDDEWNRNWKVWPSATVSGFALMITFGYLVHILEFKQGQIKVINGVLCKGEIERNEDLQEIEMLRLECFPDRKDARASLGGASSETAAFGRAGLPQCAESPSLPASLGPSSRTSSELQGGGTQEQGYELERVPTH